MIDPIFPSSGSPVPPGPPKRDYGRATYVLAVVTIVIAVLAALVAVLAWVHPFQAVIPAPFQQTPAPPPPPPDPKDGIEGSQEKPDPSAPLAEETPAPEPAPSEDLQETESSLDLQEGMEVQTIAGSEARSAPGEDLPSGRTRDRSSPRIGRSSGESGLPTVKSDPPLPEPPPPPDPFSEDSPTPDDNPDISVGDNINVTAEGEPTIEYRDPEGPRLLGSIALPKLPADALRSLADGKQLEVKVWVTTDGRGRVTSMEGAWMPEPLRKRYRDELERRPWKPRKDRRGSLVNSEAEVAFTWKRR